MMVRRRRPCLVIDETVDSILAACTLLCVRDVLGAEPSWRDNLEYATGMIHNRGGPANMLRGDQYSFGRRCMLERLAFHDLIGRCPAHGLRELRSDRMLCHRQRAGFTEQSRFLVVR